MDFFPFFSFQICAILPAVSGVSLRWVNQTGESTKPPAQEFINYPNHTCKAVHLLLKCRPCHALSPQLIA